MSNGPAPSPLTREQRRRVAALEAAGRLVSTPTLAGRGPISVLDLPEVTATAIWILDGIQDDAVRDAYRDTIADLEEA